LNEIDLINELSAKVNLLDTAVRELGKRGQKYAQAEHDYKVRLSQQILIERDKGMPVTIISDICRGNAEIAKLRFERDVAEVAYKAAQEAINSYKLQVRILDSQISREWSNVK
jgi:hypothetical protein